MNRLTEHHYNGDGAYMVCSGTCYSDAEICGSCQELEKIIDRLAAYEDTGLEPEDIEGIKAIAVLGTMSNVRRATEIMDAEREGRLVVLPCKVGDTVYPIGADPRFDAKIIGIGIESDGKIWAEWAQYDRNVDDPDELWDEDTFYVEELGKTVFLTHEEAEAALRKEQG